MHEPSDYLAIRLWGVNLGSFTYYIYREQKRAAYMGAPLDALYLRGDKWVCVSDLAPDHRFRAQYAAALAAQVAKHRDSRGAQ